ncbi:MAG: sel1 repeat family protein [Azoarcus sp.]|nr:sel1 repeat family protein [Azoarcus sp.]
MLIPVFSARAALLVVAAALSLGGCAQPAKRDTVMVCDPHCSERSRNQTNQDLKDTGDDDGKIAALEEAAKNNARAAYDLSLRYFRGDGITRDSYKALSWMRVAAEKGNFAAQKALGRLYLTGLEEMGRDPREAQTWLSLAASRGDKESAELLAEAEAARRSEEAEWKWLHRWRPLVWRWWYSGYSYYGTWNGRYWVY